MRRFFVEGLEAKAGRVELTGEEFRHLSRVLRLAAGSEVALFNGRGIELSGRVESVGRSSASVVITGAAEGRTESPLKLAILQALLKGDRPELIVQKATELGASEVCFYPTPRTVALVKEGQAANRLARWRKVAIEAAKQCGRSVLPSLSLAPSLKEAVSGRGGLKLMLWEQEGAEPIGRALARATEERSAALLIGPEGGLSAEDAATAAAAGFVKVGLGPRVLRAETAALAAISIAQHSLGDLG